MAVNYKTWGLGVGLFSLALGAAELLASRRITAALDAEEQRGRSLPTHAPLPS